MSDAGFNERWARHAAPQVSLGGFWQKTGWTPSTFVGKRVLDAGCGCGRYTKLAIECGAAEVVALDASPAALAACAKNAPFATVVSGDLLSIDPAIGEFDLAFSMGVLHHTASTERAFHQVAQRVRPGGELAVFVYSRPVIDPVNLYRVNMLHEITRSLDPATLHAICAKYATKIRDTDPAAWDPLHQVMRVSTSSNDEECISDTFDWHAPQYRYWHTDQQVAEWFRAAGFINVRRNPFPVSSTGTKR